MRLRVATQSLGTNAVKYINKCSYDGSVIWTKAVVSVCVLNNLFNISYLCCQGTG